MRRPKRPSVTWPSWRYGPNGESAIFQCAEDVPADWTRKPDELEEPRVERPLIRLDREALFQQLKETWPAITPSSKWSTAYVKELVDNGQQEP